MSIWKPEATATFGTDAIGERRARGYRLWLVAATFLVLAGILGAVSAARSLAQNDAEKSHQAFKAASGDIASTLGLAIEHEQDLVVNASTFVAGDPTTTSADLARWLATSRASQRYPELRSIGLLTIVRSAALSTFAVRAESDPAGTLGPGGKFSVVPAGIRPYYCFLQALGYTAPGSPRLPAGLDLCRTEVGSGFLAIRDSGQGSYVPASLGGPTLLEVTTPVYRGGVVPSTVAARRAAFIGGLATQIVPKTVLETALRGHPDTAVRFQYRAGSSKAVFRDGKAPDGAQSTTIDLRNGWTVRTFGAVSPGSVIGNWSATALLIAGVAFSLLLGALLFVLGTGRARALRLVGERTGELRHQALHDALTGLPNRALIVDRIDQLLARHRHNGTMGAVLFVDLDEFKNVNDSLGHETGDRLLVAVAARLSSTLRDADTIGRMGGDEFVVLLDGATLEINPGVVAERLLDVMRQPFDLDGAAMPMVVNTSIGIAMGERASAGELLRDADVALYEAKAQGKNRHVIFAPEMQTEISRRMELELALRSALEDEQFHLAYRPICNLDDLTIVGIEALLRWEHPTRGLVGADEFVPILEQTGEIQDVGGWVLRQACTQMAAWHASGDTLDISINVSPRQLCSTVIVAHIRDALNSSGLAASSLIVGVPESALIRNAAANQQLQAIKELGVRIAVNDFGTGYSSLGYLRQFPVDCLKIDHAFSDAIATSPESRTLVATLVQLGRDLGLTILAEGVEPSSQVSDDPSSDEASSPASQCQSSWAPRGGRVVATPDLPVTTTEPRPPRPGVAEVSTASPSDPSARTRRISSRQR